MKPVRVLHVVGQLNPGGVEVWLRQIVRLTAGEPLQMDFLTLSAEPGVFDEELRQLGSSVIPCGGHRNPWAFSRRVQGILMEHGPYDAVHSHVHHYSGVVLRAAAKAGVPTRIAHSHSDLAHAHAASPMLRQAYFRVMKGLVRRWATHGLACSSAAARSLFGEGWEQDGRWQVMMCGIDLAPFREEVNRDEVRASLGIAPDELVVGHVGSFRPVKNHRFLVEVFAALHAKEPKARLLLVGDGPLRPETAQAVERAGLSERVLFLGIREDIPKLMKGAMDVFVLPSLYEGLPLSLVEAQCSGLKSVYADTITEEVIVAKHLMTECSLDGSVENWSNAVLHQAYSDSTSACFDTTRFSINNSIYITTYIYYFGH